MWAIQKLICNIDLPISFPLVQQLLLVMDSSLKTIIFEYIHYNLFGNTVQDKNTLPHTLLC